jgi:hypothetical protein
MTVRRRAAIELVLAVLAFAGCALSWLQSRSTVRVAPIAAGEPPTTSVTFYAPLLVLALVLLTVAGVLAVVAVARLRRSGPVANVQPVQPVEPVEPAPPVEPAQQAEPEHTVANSES